MLDKKDYTVYDYDRLTEGAQIKLEHTVYFNDDVDLSDLISKPMNEVASMREKSVAVEKAAYDKVRETTKEWEQAAAVTRRLDRALEYLETLPVSHTSNQWKDEQYGNHSISNMVYKMTYNIYERTGWRDRPTKYDVRWNIFTNSPQNSYNVSVAGQERTFSDKAAAEKYIQGRIKAYAHLFTEISPPIPQEYERAFRVYGHLLPGYTTEKMQRAKAAEQAEKSEVPEKPSIRKELKTLKAADKVKPEPKPEKKRTAPEL